MLSKCGIFLCSDMISRNSCLACTYGVEDGTVDKKAILQPKLYTSLRSLLKRLHGKVYVGCQTIVVGGSATPSRPYFPKKSEGIWSKIISVILVHKRPVKRVEIVAFQVHRTRQGKNGCYWQPPGCIDEKKLRARVAQRFRLCSRK